MITDISTQKAADRLQRIKRTLDCLQRAKASLENAELGPGTTALVNGSGGLMPFKDLATEHLGRCIDVLSQWQEFEQDKLS